MHPGRKAKFSAYAVIGVFCIAAAVALYVWNPAKHAAFPPCPFHYLTGLYCPGCGSLRALHGLLHGRLVEAISLNPLMVLSIPVVGIMFFKPSWIYKPWVPWAVLAVVLTYGIARNIPIWPFGLPAP